MATIVVVPSGVTSKRLLVGRLADALAGAGHDVVWADDGSRDDPVLQPAIHRRDRGLHVGEDTERRRWRPRAQRRATHRLADALDPAPWLAVIDDRAPDLVLVDIEEFAPLVVLRGQRPAVPVAVLNTFFGIWPVAGSPPLDSALVPRGGVAGRGRELRAWTASKVRLRWRDVRHHLAGRKVEPVSVTRRLAHRFGVRDEMTTRAWLHPFVPARLPVLSLVSAALDLPHRGPEHDRAVGALLDPIGADELATVGSPELAAFVAAAGADGAPLVVVASGGFMADGEAFTDTVLTAFDQMPELRAVVAFAGRPSVPVPGNVHLSDWIPQRAVLAHAAVAVVHSGTGTLHECVAAGVPMVVYPFAVNDQAGNAARVRFHRIGRVGERSGLTAATIVDDVRAVLADDGVRARVGELGASVRADSGTGSAVSAVEALLAARSHVSDP